MGEIKSTFDLVMERTKHLTLSDEEKQHNKKEDIINKIKSLVTKYEDGALRYSEFDKEVGGLGKSFGKDIVGLVAQEVLGRLDVLGDNGPLLDILKNVCRRDTVQVQQTIDRFKERAGKEAGLRSRAVVAQLKSDLGISGSAVSANLENDEDLDAKLKDLQVQFRRSVLSA